MAANLVQFPLTVSQLTSGARFNTEVIVGGNTGYEQRNSLQQDPRRVYNAAYSVRTLVDAKTLYNFFMNMRGREQSFLILDQMCHAIPQWTAAAVTGNGVRTTFQLRVAYTFGGYTTYLNVTKPKSGAETVRVNGVTKSNPADYTVSLSTGIITFVSAPANGHVVDFGVTEFYVPVRFDVDELPIELLGFWQMGGGDYAPSQIPPIPLVEVFGE